MSEERVAVPSDYAVLGLVNNPFPPIALDDDTPFWVRVVTHAATNRLLSGCARAKRRSRPVMVTSPDTIPDYYHRVVLNTFLGMTARDEKMSMLAMSVPFEVMKLGTIRGLIAEVSERVSAMDLPLTVGLYFAQTLKDPDLTLPEAAALGEGQIEEAAEAFAADPGAATVRFLGPRPDDTPVSQQEEFDALHMTYLKGVGLEPNPVEDDTDPGRPEDLDYVAPVPQSELDAEVRPDDLMRDYLLALVRADISPVLGRALAGYRRHGEMMVAQELKLTKAPRKTLKALLRLMSHRWDTIVVLWEQFDVWPDMETDTRVEVMNALNELRYIVGEFGVMGVNVVPGVAPELEEMFEGGEQVDWSLPGLETLYRQDFSWDPELVQSWIDSASVELPCPVRLDGSELAPIVEAAEADVMRFAVIAEAAFRSAAARQVATLDAEAAKDALASVTIEEGA